MNLRHLKIFIMVADCKNMSLAAERLFISQPSVSQTIKELENYYGIKAFERLSKKLYITESGELLLKYARHLVQSFEEVETEMKNKGQNISLRIGSTITVGTCMLNDIIEKLEDENKDILPRIIINNSNVIEKMILNSELDIGIVEGNINNKDIVKIPVYKDELAFIVGKRHELYKIKEIEISQLNGQDMIFREDGSGVRETIDKLLKENNIEVNPKWISSDTEAIKRATICGQGISVLSTMLIGEELKNGTLHKVKIKGIEIPRDICAIYHKDKFMSEHLKSFIKVLKTKMPCKL